MKKITLYVTYVINFYAFDDLFAGWISEMVNICMMIIMEHCSCNGFGNSIQNTKLSDD